MFKCKISVHKELSEGSLKTQLDYLEVNDCVTIQIDSNCKVTIEKRNDRVNCHAYFYCAQSMDCFATAEQVINFIKKKQ